jgi:predicted dehydrogenase
MKFLIAGYGSIGRRHLRNLQTLGEKDITVYRTHHSTLPEDELAGIAVETDLQAALAKKPDAVIIANPTALHMAVAIPAAEAGCSLLIEKPIADDLDEADALKAALARGKGRALVGFQFRYHPTLQQAAWWLSEGKIGQVVSARAHWGEYLPNWHPWEDYKQSYAARPDLGGGVVLTLTHPLDYLRWLLGEVSGVWAFIGTLGELDLAVEDTTEIGLRFKSGALGTVHLDYVQRPPSHTLEIIGSKGMLRWEASSGAAFLYSAEKNGWDVISAPEGFERNHLFLDEMKHFIRVAQGLEQPLCSLDDGIQVQKLALAVKRSAQNGAMVLL